MRELNLFEHVTLDHEFRDEYLFYQYRHGRSSFSSVGDVTGEINRIGSHSDIAGKADAFKMCIDIRDRTYRMQSYRQCFIGAGKLWIENEGFIVGLVLSWQLTNYLRSNQSPFRGC